MDTSEIALRVMLGIILMPMSWSVITLLFPEGTDDPSDAEVDAVVEAQRREWMVPKKDGG